MNSLKELGVGRWQHWLVFIVLSQMPMLALAADRVVSMEEAAKQLSGGGYVLMMRHAQTEPGTGDPPGFEMGKCDTQRNLSDEGREQARRIGGLIKAAGIKFGQVRNSAWCRCRETAKLAFGPAASTDWKALNSFYADRSTEAEQTAELHRTAESLEGTFNIMWVTHQVNITAALGIPAGQGEIIAAKTVKGRLQAQFRIKP